MTKLSIVDRIKYALWGEYPVDQTRWRMHDVIKYEDFYIVVLKDEDDEFNYSVSWQIFVPDGFPVREIKSIEKSIDK